MPSPFGDLPSTIRISTPSKRNVHTFAVFLRFSTNFLSGLPSISRVYSYWKPLTASMWIVALLPPTLKLSFPTSLNIQLFRITSTLSTKITRFPVVVPCSNWILFAVGEGDIPGSNDVSKLIIAHFCRQLSSWTTKPGYFQALSKD